MNILATRGCRFILQRGAQLFSYRSTAVRPYKSVGFITKVDTWFSEHLTEDNQKFMKSIISEEYKQLTMDRLSPLKDEPWPRHQWTEGSRRVGLIGIKLGMAPMWTKDGKRSAVTMVQVRDCHVLKHLPKEEFNGKTDALLVGGKNTSPFYKSENLLELYRNAGVPVKQKVSLFRVSENALLKPGTPLFAAHYRPGQYVDITAKSIGKGFQGVMKRWGFKGQPASHGQTKTHRRPGSIGQGQDPGRVFKGTKMPGKMGNSYVTDFGMKIVRVNTKYNLLYIQGTIPGHSDCLLKITDTRLPNKKVANFNPYFPTYFVEEHGELDEDLYDEELFVHTEPSIMLS